MADSGRYLPRHPETQLLCKRVSIEEHLGVLEVRSDSRCLRYLIAPYQVLPSFRLRSQ